MKKLIIILTNVFLLTISTSSCAMSGNKKNSSFENYQTTQDLQDALNKRYPKNSDLSDLISYLEKSGCTCRDTKFSKAENHNISLSEKKKLLFRKDSPKIESKEVVLCHIIRSSKWLTTTSWRIAIYKNKNNKIQDISVNESKHGL